MMGAQPIKLYLLKLGDKEDVLEFQDKWARNLVAMILNILGKNPQVSEILAMEEPL